MSKAFAQAQRQDRQRTPAGMAKCHVLRGALGAESAQPGSYSRSADLFQHGSGPRKWAGLTLPRSADFEKFRAARSRR